MLHGDKGKRRGGIRQLGKPAEVEGDTKFMIASNTKGLTTLVLATLVDEGRLSWDSPATMQPTQHEHVFVER